VFERGKAHGEVILKWFNVRAMDMENRLASAVLYLMDFIHHRIHEFMIDSYDL
jgi:hypothetical protein